MLNIVYKSSPSSQWTTLITIDYEINQWSHIEVHLPQLSAEYQIAFEAAVNGGYGVCLDELYVGEPLGITEKENSNFFIYPNPSNGIFNIMISDFSQGYNIQIFDISGKEMLKTDIDKPLTTINLTNYESGIYIIKVKSSQNSFFRKIIIE
jgi:hypothetical protein